jgi:sirohydrochlorin cobaltochelatase
LKQGIVLFAHGSRDPEWSRPFELIAASVGRKSPAVCVALGYLEHGPSLHEAIAALAAKGATVIRIVPLFLGTGGHVKEDLPRLVAQAGTRFSGIVLTLDKPIGDQPPVVEAIASAISAAR